MNLKEAIRTLRISLDPTRNQVIGRKSYVEAVETLISAAEMMLRVGEVIAEEKAKWSDVEPDNKFGVGVRAGIESVEYRLREKGISQY